MWPAPAAVLMWLGFGGCGALNPAFVNVVDPSGTSGVSTLSNAPGHVVVAFINNAEIDERLITFVTSADGGNLELTDVERRALRPRLRLRTLVTFQNGSTMNIEFIDGSTKFVDQNFNAESEPDLNQNTLNNVVLTCDVASVQVIGGTIEAFIPVELIGYEQQLFGAEGNQVLVFVATETQDPQFRDLLVDTVDTDGNIVLQQNIGVRDVPAPVNNPLCGSVISIEVNGVLSVPFTVDDEPSYDVNDVESVASIGGRYEFIVSIR